MFLDNWDNNHSCTWVFLQYNTIWISVKAFCVTTDCIKSMYCIGPHQFFYLNFWIFFDRTIFRRFFRFNFNFNHFFSDSFDFDILDSLYTDSSNTVELLSASYLLRFVHCSHFPGHTLNKFIQNYTTTTQPTCSRAEIIKKDRFNLFCHSKTP